jgi:Na+-translocating ferredoxin:NAD+ oxidoreductase RnfG subunit
MAEHTPSWLVGPGLVALAVAPAQVVIAAEYLSIEQAQQSLFASADRFEEIALALTPAQKDSVAKLAGPQPPHRSLRIWRALRSSELLGYVFIDEVIGRQDFITYALGIDAAGKLSTVEVLAYRESHGAEIRGTGWRHQFEGRRGLDQLHFRADIKNIAGATLSSEHVTQGVRWLVGLWQTVLQSGPTAAT